jgi:hypothetical protein
MMHDLEYWDDDSNSFVIVPGEDTAETASKRKRSAKDDDEKDEQNERFVRRRTEKQVRYEFVAQKFSVSHRPLVPHHPHTGSHGQRTAPLTHLCL